MGLLDSLSYGSQGGYGSLLDGLLYPSPLLKPPEIPQPQYDAMGNYTGITQQPADPFGPLPAMAGPQPGSFQPPSIFSQGAAPLAGVTSGVLMGPQQAPQQPASPQPAPAPAPQAAAPMNLVPPQFAGAPGNAPQDISAQSRQPPPDQQPQLSGQLAGNLPAALGGRPDGFFDRLNTGLQSLGNGGSLIGALTGNQTDSQSTAKQNLKAQYDVLVPLVGPQKAMLAVMNPEAGKTILAQALEKKQYGFTKLDNDTVIANDPQTGRSTVSYGGGEANKTGVAGPDGKIIPYPEGLDAASRKIFANEIARINADAAAGKLTEVQAKNQKFGTQMELAEHNISGLEGQGRSLFGQIASNVPLGNYAQSNEYRKYTQAKNSFITAVLRDESGAAIGKPEFVRREKEMFPQPGDDDATMQQKAELRRIAIEGMKKGAGPGYKSPNTQEQSSSGVRKYNPATGKIE